MERRRQHAHASPAATARSLETVNRFIDEILDRLKGSQRARAPVAVDRVPELQCQRMSLFHHPTVKDCDCLAVAAPNDVGADVGSLSV